MKETFEIKLDKRTLLNFLFLLIVIISTLEFVELLLIAQSIKTGAICR